ncbi:hypothetical protein NQ317_005493 [Molorchus minor]|uniref:Sodium/calcium exchanger membrane region domain-containing protein n=1 Tax=Molorchus minor TaxID=1323400 RepID=A0ABQ9JS37_9CUCU|nr:hypothetical protein NQ317_005493 [Molorchus minor]
MKFVAIIFIVTNIVFVSCWQSSEVRVIKIVPTNDSQLDINIEKNTTYEHSTVNHYLKHRTFIPFARPLKDDPDNLTDECSGSSDDFPDFLSEDILRKGGIILCFLVGVYCFTLLALVCDGYFLPCVETTCDIFHLTPDVTAATFMSVATSTPELFTNIIGTFVTESDIGIGTIVGSSLYNALGVAAIGGLAAPYPLQLDWWPLTRDVCIYTLAVSMLVVITWDGLIFWYEALVLFIAYFIYFSVMFQNHRISRWVKSHFEKDKVVEFQKEEEKEKHDGRVSSISANGKDYLEETKKSGYDNQHEKDIKELDAIDEKETRKEHVPCPRRKFQNKVPLLLHLAHSYLSKVHHSQHESLSQIIPSYFF